MKFQSKNNSAFFEVLNGKVDNYFSTNNISRFADTSVLLKGAFLVCVFLVSYFLLLFVDFGDTASILLLVTAGFSSVMIVFNLVHDASHKVLFEKKSLNRSVAYLGDLLGMNSYIWNIRHNMQHHSFTNVAGGDILLDAIPLVRISSGQKKLWIHKFQIFYAPLLYALYSLFWVLILDTSFFFKKNMGNLRNIRHSRSEWARLIFFKLTYFTYMLVIPCLVTDYSFLTVLLGFLIYHMAAGILLSLVVVLGHCVEGVQYVSPDENGIIRNSWMQHEWETTSDCATGSKFLHWVSGGLNTHLVHHLFPKICHGHYYNLTRLIKEHCRESGWHYPHHNFGNAIISHFRFLQKQALVDNT